MKISIYLVTILILFGCDNPSHEPTNNAKIVTKFNDSTLISSQTDILKSIIADSTVFTFKNKYGNGILIFNLDSNDIGKSISFYNNSIVSDSINLVRPNSLVTVQRDGHSFSFNFDNGWDIFQYYPDYEFIHVICYETDSLLGIHKIKFKDTLSSFINTYMGKFYSWPDYLSTIVYGIDPKDFNTNRPRQKPNQHSEFVDASHLEEVEYAFNVIETEGDWVKVEYIAICGGEELIDLFGWIKWRNEFDLLIDIYLMC